MKIQSGAIRSGISEVQQGVKNTEAVKITKEVLPDAKNVQAYNVFDTHLFHLTLLYLNS